MVCAGWTIGNPTNFFNRFGGPPEADPMLGTSIESAKNQVVGNHPFSHFVSTDRRGSRSWMWRRRSKKPSEGCGGEYGIEVRFVGIKTGLPESVTKSL